MDENEKYKHLLICLWCAMFGVKEIDSSQLGDWMRGAAESFLLLDVRSVAEMTRGMLPGAAPMPMHLVPVRVEELRKEANLVVYCQTGARSAQVCAFLQRHGVDQALNLRGGILDWQRSGYPVEASERCSLAV